MKLAHTSIGWPSEEQPVLSESEAEAELSFVTDLRSTSAVQVGDLVVSVC